MPTWPRHEYCILYRSTWALPGGNRPISSSNSPGNILLADTKARNPRTREPTSSVASPAT
ncbi:unnamed protein product [Fusarium graminearum]|uniref:Chromosome 4, complete genome n=1 Tax=Gibberella zeae (strain ATCC MYA-4620 / CBS 123657 / FGSC 9075 / NRRL 31084 / PH-1) TaxID=229533 RepID=A0A098DV13_GIBZE|nr:unnamed protein product [Fusarium graminearum]CZS74146.1 unnamed protein product [Fusarium graminearum]